jgi:16S rRNA G527 N7-methylase RsmG
MTSNQYTAAVERVMKDLGGVQTRLGPDILSSYLEELFSWNQRLGLVSKKDSEKTVARLIQLSISLWDFVSKGFWPYSFMGLGMNSERSGSNPVTSFIPTPSGETAEFTFLDIGTGGGFPGLVWKMIKPDLGGCLVERKDTKAQFLQRVIRTIGWQGVQVVTADAGDLYEDPQYRESFSLVTMIAVKPTSVLAQAIASFLRPAGYFCTVRSSSHKLIEDRLGETLLLHNAVTTNEGILVLYRKTL